MRRCLNCGAMVKRGHGYKSATKYCSYECYQAKPPRVIEVELEFKDTIENLLLETSGSMAHDARSLGINRDTLKRWKEKYI